MLDAGLVDRCAVERQQLRSRAFLVATLVMLLLVGATTALNGVLTEQTTYRVALTGPAPPRLGAALQRAADPFDATVRLSTIARPAAAREAPTGSSFARTSTPSSPRSPTRPSARSAAACRRSRS